MIDGGKVEGKVWGEDVLLFGSPSVEVHLLKVLPGGFCSRHYHRAKRNRFFVMEGSLTVVTVRGKFEDKTELKPGWFKDVYPGEVHLFEGGEKGAVVLEFCWVELEAEDIERLESGGRK